eukprot:262664_1
MPKSKKKSNKKNKKHDTKKKVEKGKYKWETTLHGYPMTGPFTPGTEVWYCDHKKCQYTKHGLYRKYKIENWRSTKFGKDFTLCDGCVRQYKKEKAKAPQSQSSSSNVNVKININGANPNPQPGFQPGMAPQQQYMPQQYGPPQGYAAPQAYMNGYPPQQPMQPYPQPMQMGQPNPQYDGYYAQPPVTYANPNQPMVKPPPPVDAPPPQQGTVPTAMEQKEQTMDSYEDIVVNGVVKQGWMMKKGDIVKSWKKRYFVLKSNQTLNYYESDNAVMVKGTCPLDKVKSVIKKSGQSFEIQTSKRKWCFACKDTETRDGWVKKIKSVAEI